jgi:exodeoxyribonuclease V alpha subunit
MIPLHPEGAARHRLGELGDGSRFPAALRDVLGELDLGDEQLYLAWALAREARLPAADERALTLLVLALLVTMRQGSTRLPTSGAEGEAHLSELFAVLGGGPAELARARTLCADLLGARLGGAAAPIDPIAGLPGERRPLLVDGYALYTGRMHACEVSLAAALSARLSSTTPPFSPEAAAAALDDVVSRPARIGGRAIVLGAGQRRALEAALARPLAVISGGPGTGKTSIVAALLRVLARLGVASEEIALAAPTGKAAFRICQAIARGLADVEDPSAHDRALRVPEAQTLHRLLGWSPSRERFLSHKNDRLAARVVIVDECSMIDLYLMERLAQAVRDDAVLVLLGDADQLPSVEAGAVFRDLSLAAVQLAESYRMSPSDPDGRRVLGAALGIREGRADEALEAITARERAADVAFAGAERLPASERAAFLARWHAERVHALPDLDRLVARTWRLGDSGFAEEDVPALAALFDHFDRFRLLTVTRGFSPAGAARLNALIHERTLAAARASGDADLLRGAPAFYPGEPVIVQRNDYERGLWNGDQGLVLRVAEPGRGHHFMAVFPREPGFAAFHIDALRPSLALGWAATVHKSQGSELDHVALILPDEDLPLSSRELVYTALTRARRSAVVVGDPALLRQSIARKVRRFSGLALRLRSVT